jgi:hypothetical protein
MSEELLKALELEKIVTVPIAAKIAGISTDGFKRHYAHLIRQITPRRIGVKVRDVIAIGGS